MVRISIILSSSIIAAFTVIIITIIIVIVQHFLQRAAEGVGLPKDRFLSHSLRVGGATALYQATTDIELVKRMGRWTSSAVHRYLQDGGAVKGVSQKMEDVNVRHT